MRPGAGDSRIRGQAPLWESVEWEGFALEKARGGWALGLDADFAHSTRRIIEEYTRSIGS